MLLAVMFLSGLNRRAHRIRSEQSAALLVQLEQLRSQQEHMAVLDERARIAREIHDVLAHSLGALSIQIAHLLPPGRAVFPRPGPATAVGGYGLRGMRERLLLLGGTLDTGVRDGRWVVLAQVPR